MAAAPTKWTVLLGVGLFLPALGGGFYVDDWFHRAFLEEVVPLPKRHALDLFRFASDEIGSPLVGNFLPWWAGDQFQAAFFRPVAAMTHVLDSVVFGWMALGHHATSLLIWGVMLSAVVRLYQRLAELSTESQSPVDDGPEVPKAPPFSLAVALAGLIFALDEAHVWPIGWVANRNALLASLFVVLGVHSYLSFRRGGGRLYLLALLGSFVLALGCSELGVTLVFWTLAYELCLARDSWAVRCRALAPLGFTLALYLVFWTTGGYGTRGSGLYIDPFAEPASFVQAGLLTRLPMLLLGIFSPVVPDIAFAFRQGEVDLLLAGLGWACSGVMAWALWPILRADPVARWMMLAALLSLVPVCATFPHGRLLLLSTVGTSWVLARYLGSAWSSMRAVVEGGAALPTPGSRRLVPLLVGTHLLWAPGAAVFGLVSFFAVGGAINTVALGADLPVGKDARVLSLNTPDPVSPTYLPLIRAGMGEPMPWGYWSLSIAPAEQTLVRTGADRFTLEVASPGFGATDWEQLFRRGLAFEQGEVFERGVMGVRADVVVDGELRRIEVQLDRPLDDPGVALIAWNGRRMAPLALPQVGGCLSVPAPILPFPLPSGDRGRPAETCEEGARFVTSEELLAASTPTVPSPASAAPPETGQCRLEVSTGGPWVERAAFSCPEVGPLRVLVAGDFGRPGPIVEATAAAMRAECGRKPCHLLVLPGDILYGLGTSAVANWAGAWTRGLGTVGLPSLAVLGNHAYRHEPLSELRRAHLYAQDGKGGFVLPAASYAARVRRGEETILAIGALDTDSVANPGPDMPGLGLERLVQACAEGAPTLSLGHHPPSSQGRHHSHEQQVEAGLTQVLSEARRGGCNLVAALAGHDHDLQAYPPGCEAADAPAVLVSGVAGKGSRARESTHLDPCPLSGAASRYHAGPREAGGYILIEPSAEAGASRAVLWDAPLDGPPVELSRLSW